MPKIAEVRLAVFGTGVSADSRIHIHEELNDAT
jgi:hypothetical protein